METNLKKDIILNGFDELVPKPLPTKPAKILEYEGLKAEGKKVTDSFWQQMDIRDYLDQKWKVIQKNFVNKAWLKENLKRFEQENNHHYIEIIKNRIQDFNEWEDDNWKELEIYRKN